MTETHQPALPIILITGYLGSGKTTLLNQLLASAGGRRLAVLINDFGAINVDEKLVEGAIDGVVPLENGCICCSLEGGLHAAIARVLRAQPLPEAILIEASGVSNAGELSRVLRDEALRGYAQLELIITTFDCDYWQVCSEAERDLIRPQLRHANVLVLTKTELVNEAQRAAAHAIVGAASPGALIIAEQSKQVTLDMLLGSNLQRPDHEPQMPEKVPSAGEIFRSWQVRHDAPMTKAEFQGLLNNLPPQTVRGKGHIHLLEFPATRFLFQMVGKRASVVPAGDWGQTAPRTEVVFIAMRSRAPEAPDFSLAATT